VTITVMKSGLSVPERAGDWDSRSRVCYRGEVVTLSPELVEMTRDRHGNSWLDLTEDQQVERWGDVRFKRGDHSAEVAFVGDDDSTVRYRRRENAVMVAQKIADPAERKAAFAEITATYGASPSSQRTLRSYGD
jgi:hypothetical protein